MGLMWQYLILALVGSVPCSAKPQEPPVTLNEDSWREMLSGEWLVKFYAPWCPACRALVPVWEHVAGWSDDLDIKVASVDVTANPGLSGRFLVTALPSIYHVKDGQFRQYQGPRGENEIVSFVDDKKWEELDPLPWYTSPTAIHMGLLGQFFKLSVAIRDLHGSMTTEYGIPVWGSYCIFALATILAGLLLGLLIVYLCDVIYPPLPSLPPRPLHIPRPLQEDIREDDSDMIEDDRKLEQPSESSPEDKQVAGDSQAEGSGSEDGDDEEAGDEDGGSQAEDEKEKENIVEFLPSQKESQSGGDVRPSSARKRQKASNQ